MHPLSTRTRGDRRFTRNLNTWTPARVRRTFVSVDFDEIVQQPIMRRTRRGDWVLFVPPAYFDEPGSTSPAHLAVYLNSCGVAVPQ